MEYAAYRSPLELLAGEGDGLHPTCCWDVIMPGESGISAAREIRQFDNDVKDPSSLTSSAEFCPAVLHREGVLLPAQAIREETFFQLMDSVIEECRSLGGAGESSAALSLRTASPLRLDKLEYCEIISDCCSHMANGQVLENAGVWISSRPSWRGLWQFPAAAPGRSW